MDVLGVMLIFGIALLALFLILLVLWALLPPRRRPTHRIESGSNDIQRIKDKVSSEDSYY